MIHRPCQGGCGKAVPGNAVHCDNPDCAWKTFNSRRAARKQTLFRFPKAPLVAAWNAVASSRRPGWQKPEKHAA